MRVETVLPAILLLTVTGACAGEQAGVSQEPPTSWTVPAKYAFTIDSRCGERALIGRFQVTVQDDKVVQVRGLDDAARRAQMLRLAELVPTLRQLELQAETARRDGAHLVEVERDAGDAHPTRITIDWSRDAVDDEACYTIEDYTIGLAGGPSPSPSR